jgi:predicted Fe-Mo cluster-binding NifX family protein
MKIAIVTDDGSTISAHLGRAEYYVVVEVGGGLVLNRERIHKGDFHASQEHSCGCHEHGHHEHSGQGEHVEGKHHSMFAPIADCKVLIAGGMGGGAQRGLQQLGIQPLLTDIKDVDEAVQAYLDGSLENHPERVH